MLINVAERATPSITATSSMLALLSDGKTHEWLLVSCFGRAIVGPLIALATSISVTGLGEVL